MYLKLFLFLSFFFSVNLVQAGSMHDDDIKHAVSVCQESGLIPFFVRNPHGSGWDINYVKCVLVTQGMSEQVKYLPHEIKKYGINLK